MGQGHRNADGKLAVWVTEDQRQFLESLTRHHREFLREVPEPQRGPDYLDEVVSVDELIRELTEAGT